jgi:hypothetical protein
MVSMFRSSSEESRTVTSGFDDVLWRAAFSIRFLTTGWITPSQYPQSPSRTVRSNETNGYSVRA